MSKCLKCGIRIYPVPIFGSYYLEVEINKTSKFLKKDIKKIIKGEQRFDPKKSKWIDKIREMYEYFYSRI